jgi:hypothetical protein
MSRIAVLRQVLGVAALAAFPAFFLFPHFKHLPKLLSAATLGAGLLLSRPTGLRAALIRATIIWLAGIQAVALVATGPALATSDRESEVYPLLLFHGLFGAGYWYLYRLLPPNAAVAKAAAAASSGRGRGRE